MTYMKCCCITGCCGVLNVPSGWTLISECCAEKVTEFTNDWVVLCSASVRTDTQSASIDYLIYKQLYQKFTIDDFVLPATCDIDGVPSVDCVVPDCSLISETLCNTVTETRSQTTESKVVVRYKILRQIDTLTRVSTACDGGAVECKWLLVSSMVGTLQHGQFAFIDGVHTFVDTAYGNCCGDYSSTTTTTALTCASRAATLTGGTTFALTRSRYFNTEPSGTYSLAPGAIANCTPLVGPCTGLGDDVVDVCSVNPGAVLWVAPTCNAGSFTIPCRYLVFYRDVFYALLYWLCRLDEHPTIRVTIRTAIPDGSLLNGLTNTFNPDPEVCGFLCPNRHPDLPAQYLLDYRISAIDCANLTSSRTDSGYMPACVTIQLSAWSVTI